MTIHEPTSAELERSPRRRQRRLMDWALAALVSGSGVFLPFAAIGFHRQLSDPGLRDVISLGTYGGAHLTQPAPSIKWAVAGALGAIVLLSLGVAWSILRQAKWAFIAVSVLGTACTILSVPRGAPQVAYFVLISIYAAARSYQLFRRGQHPQDQ